MIHNISRYIMTLALLLTAVGGAWATDPNTVIWNGNETTWKGWTDSETTHTVGDITITCSGNAKAYEHKYYSGRPLVMVAGTTDAITFTSNGAPFTSIKIKMYGNTDPGLAGWTWDNGHNIEWSGTPSTSVTLNDCEFAADMITFTFAASEPAIDVKWDPATKTGTFEMPAYDVEIAPIYAPVAQWAVVENVQQLPTAIEGIYAESTDAIVKAGTVAKIGETENVQGTLMYAVGKSATEQPALTTFSATLPTAKDITAAGDVYVWYYIKGADTPTGEEATAENTFNDSEICAEPIKVTVLSNKFDIQFKAANANTIEAGKATVKVGETAAEVKEGKLTGVKMNSKVTITAKEGYKFRKAEGKKKSAYEHSITIAVDPGTTVPTATAPAMTIEFNTGETWADVAARYDWLDTYLTYTVCYKGNNLIGDVHDANGGVSPGETIDPNGSYHWGM